MFYLKLQRRFRYTRKLYFPTMKFLYWFWSHFSPVEPNRIMFESSVGQRYEDSPRVIYGAMVSTYPDLEYIWVSRNDQPLQANPNTKIFRRLSFDYYRYLVTSRYWINNQNFPTYLTKRRGTAYLQTWHGQPIRKCSMIRKLYQGRKSGYL